MTVAEVRHRVAAVVVERGAKRHRAVERSAIGDAALRESVTRKARILTRLDDAANVTAICRGRRNARAVIAVLVEAVLAVEPDTREVGIHDEVDDARDRVRAV